MIDDALPFFSIQVLWKDHSGKCSSQVPSPSWAASKPMTDGLAWGKGVPHSWRGEIWQEGLLIREQNTPLTLHMHYYMIQQNMTQRYSDNATLLFCVIL